MMGFGELLMEKFSKNFFEVEHLPKIDFSPEILIDF